MYHTYIENSESKRSGLLIIRQQENIEEIMEIQDLSYSSHVLEFIEVLLVHLGFFFVFKFLFVLLILG